MVGEIESANASAKLHLEIRVGSQLDREKAGNDCEWSFESRNFAPPGK